MRRSLTGSRSAEDCDAGALSNNEPTRLVMDIETAKARASVAALLTLSGGFLDAFTYIGHGKVFANSMTGNVVLLSVNLAAGDWHQASRHVSPIAGFACGVLAAHLLRLITPRRGSHPAIASLVFEIAFLA